MLRKMFAIWKNVFRVGQFRLEVNVLFFKRIKHLQLEVLPFLFLQPIKKLNFLGAVFRFYLAAMLLINYLLLQRRNGSPWDQTTTRANQECEEGQRGGNSGQNPTFKLNFFRSVSELKVVISEAQWDDSALERPAAGDEGQNGHGEEVRAEVVRSVHHSDQEKVRFGNPRTGRGNQGLEVIFILL